MKQIGLAATQYVQDYDEVMPYQDMGIWTTSPQHVANFLSAPAYPNFFSMVSPYLKSQGVLICPSAKRPANNPYTDNGAAFAAATATDDTNYAPNAAVLCMKVARNPLPAEIAMMQETETRQSKSHNYPFWNNDNTGTAGFPDGYYNAYQYPTGLHSIPYNGSTGFYTTSAHHFEGGNILYCDGHVKFVRRSTLSLAVFGLCRINGPLQAAPAFLCNEARLDYTPLNGTGPNGLSVLGNHH